MSGEEVFIGSIDQGTTSTRFIIYDRSAQSVGSHQVEFTQFYPQSGYQFTPSQHRTDYLFIYLLSIFYM